MTKIGKKKLRMSDGSVRTFGSSAKRDNFERVAEAVKHGWKPTGGSGGAAQNRMKKQGRKR